jgi:hypothetical protein
MAIATNGKIDGHSYMSPGTLWFSSTFGSNLMQNLEVQMKGTYDFASIAYTLVAKLVIWLYGRPKYGGHGPHKMTIEEAEQYQMKYPKD